MRSAIAVSLALSSHEMVARVMSTPGGRVVTAIAVAAQLVAVGVHAEPAGPGEKAAPAAQALAHLDRGVAAYRAGDYALARRELAAASELAPDRPNPYRWLAMAEVELGDCPSARVHIESFLSHVAAGDPRVPEVVALRDRCVATGSITIESTPPGATVRIDRGAPVGTTPLRHLALRLGAHEVLIEKPGFASAMHTDEIVATGEVTSMFTLTPARRPIYTKWWFWTAVGAVAITAAGVTYGLTRDPEPRLPPVTCDATGCHP